MLELLEQVLLCTLFLLLLPRPQHFLVVNDHNLFLWTQSSCTTTASSLTAYNSSAFLFLWTLVRCSLFATAPAINASTYRLTPSRQLNSWIKYTVDFPRTCFALLDGSNHYSRMFLSSRVNFIAVECTLWDTFLGKFLAPCGGHTLNSLTASRVCKLAGHS